MRESAHPHEMGVDDPPAAVFECVAPKIAPDVLATTIIMKNRRRCQVVLRRPPRCHDDAVLRIPSQLCRWLPLVAAAILGRGRAAVRRLGEVAEVAGPGLPCAQQSVLLLC